ncbi:MAG: FecR domain-containing protein [Opitutaceae bacterium]|nr:FecR domain-containing protein [Opitutaceae bacterium]
MSITAQHLVRLLTGALLASLLPAAALAQMTAKIVRITGNPQQATITAPGGTRSAAAVNLPIAEGSVIETGDRVDVYVETFPGAVATIRQNSRVKLAGLRLLSVGADAGKRSAELELERGKIISTLDSSKQAITKFGIRTPRGVAAARGTVYGVSAVANGTSAFVVDGNIVIDLGGGQTIAIPYGQAALNNAGSAAALATLVASSPELAADLLVAVQTLAANVAGNTSAVGGPEVATAMLQAVTTAVVTALPGQAGYVVQTLVQAAVTPGSATSGSTQTMLNAVSAITAAAVQAVNRAGGTLTQSSAAAQGAAQAVAQVAPGGSGGTTVLGLLSVIGDVATASAIQGTGGPNAAGIATTIAAAVNTGAATGTTGGTPPTVTITQTPNQASNSILITTTATAGGANATSTTTLSNAGVGPVTTQISGPGGTSTSTTTPPTGAAGGNNVVTPPAPQQGQPTITPFTPIDPAANVSPNNF